MKLIRNPEVYLVGRQVVEAGALEKFLADHDVETWDTDTAVAGQKLCETAGRLCYMSFAKPRPGGNETYLKHILEVGHGSVLEHASWNFIFSGISRTCTHELVRHRAGWAYSQLSQRYVDESVAEFVIPADLQEEVDAALFLRDARAKRVSVFPGEEVESLLRKSKYDGMTWDMFSAMAEAGNNWLEGVNHAHGMYLRLTKYLANKAAVKGLVGTEAKKFARQAARSVLPNATETKIFVTVNARAARHFIEMRASRYAEPEIRKLAVAMLMLLQADSPNIFGDYTLVSLPDGTFEAVTAHRKV